MTSNLAFSSSPSSPSSSSSSSCVLEHIYHTCLSLLDSKIVPWDTFQSFLALLEFAQLDLEDTTY